MAKSADERINETLQGIKLAFPRNGQSLKDTIQFCLMREFHSGVAREALSASISIGGFHIGGDAQRHMERLYLLVQATVGGMKSAQVREEKTRADTMTEARIKTLIQAIADTHAATKFASDIQLAESFGYAPADAADKTVKAVIKARRILGHMYQGLMTVNSNAAEKQRYERWFGRLDAVRFEKVRSSIKAVYDDITGRPLKIYYRGKGVDGKLHDKPGSMYHNKYVHLQCAVGEYGCFIPGFTIEGVETDRTHILLGESFFTKCQVASHPVDPYLMSAAGVIIHEMMHAVCDFRDQVNQTKEVLYGGINCRAEAIARPDIAIINPDNYRLYSDTFDTEGD
jgi:hypothetical protein